jgi:hypothetical protein
VVCCQAKGHSSPTSSSFTTITQTQQVQSSQGTHTNTISTMAANINTILTLGDTSGIGEAFTRYFHSKGKAVVAVGRRLERSMP